MYKRPCPLEIECRCGICCSWYEGRRGKEVELASEELGKTPWLEGVAPSGELVPEVNRGPSIGLLDQLLLLLDGPI